MGFSFVSRWDAKVLSIAFTEMRSRNKTTGELMGNTVIRVGNETKGLGDRGVVYYDHDFVLIQARIDDENTTYYSGGCSFDPPASWNPN